MLLGSIELRFEIISQSLKPKTKNEFEAQSIPIFDIFAV